MSKILVIDDNELISKFLQEALTAAGFDVALAMDANQGYAQAIEFHPDLILLDVQLPDVAGFDLIRIIKNRDELRHIPIIMITGTHSHTDHKVKAFQAGADDYVLKPFEMPELLERIKAVLRRSTVRGSSQAASSPALSGRRSTDSLPKAAGHDDKKSLSLKEIVYQTLTNPDSVAGASCPPMTLLYLFALLGLSLGGWAMSAGSTVKPVLIAIGMPGFWGLCVAALVMSCSIMGISLSWKEGAQVMCLSGLPLLLKLLGAFVMTLITSLVPFYFTASPALLFKNAPALLERLDVFELWMVWLVWFLVKRCKGASKEKAYVAAAVVWPVLAYWQSLWKQ